MIRNRKVRWRTLIVLWLVLTLVLALGGPALLKYISYERADCIPRLRESIGKRIIIPERTVHGFSQTIPERETILRSLRYRFNDEPGFFDCEITYGRDERDRGHSGSCGLSPAEARKVLVFEDSLTTDPDVPPDVASSGGQ